MRIAFLAQDVRPSGGTGVILDHSRRLAEEYGHDVELVLAEGEPAARDPGVPVRTLADATTHRYDIAIGTWWETAGSLWDLDADRWVMFVQSLEQRFYEPSDPFDRLLANAVVSLPVSYVVVATWMRDLLAQIRPDASVELAPNGIDKSTFRPALANRRNEGPLRVLVEGQPTLPFKSIPNAFRAIAAMREPVHTTLVMLEEADVSDLGADEVRVGLDPAGMAAAYADADVLLKLSRVEGLPLPPLEAFHVGTPCVVTPFTGHEDYVVHGENGIVVGFDDIEGTATWLDLLATDRDLLGRLSSGALETAARWPDTSQASADFAAALERIAAGDPPPLAPAMASLDATLRFGAELGRHRLASALGAVEWNESALERARADHVRVQTALDEVNVMLAETQQEADRRYELLRESEEGRVAAESALRGIRTSKAFQLAARIQRAANRLPRKSENTSLQ